MLFRRQTMLLSMTNRRNAAFNDILGRPVSVSVVSYGECESHELLAITAGGTAGIDGAMYTSGMREVAAIASCRVRQTAGEGKAPQCSIINRASVEWRSCAPV